MNASVSSMMQAIWGGLSKDVQLFEKVYKEKRGVTYVYSYSYEGVGIDAKPVYAEFETKFSIARGVIQDKKFTRYVDGQGKTYTSYIRRI